MEGIPWLHHIRDKRLLKQRTQTASTYFQIFYWRRYWIRAAKFERRVAVSIFPHWIKFNGVLFCLISFLVSSRGLIWSPRNDLVGTALVRQIFYPLTICSHHFAKWNFLFFLRGARKSFRFFRVFYWRNETVPGSLSGNVSQNSPDCELVVQ